MPASEHSCSEKWHVECYRQGRFTSEPLGTPAKSQAHAALIMVGTVPVRVISFLLLAACGALCQERQQNSASNSLPDAPSVQVSARTELRTSAGEARSDLTGGAVGSDAGLTLESKAAKASRTARTSFGDLDKEYAVQKNPSDFFEKHLYPSLIRRNPSYHPSTSASFLGRATDAASRIFVTRDESGRQRLNTAYLVGVLSSAALHSARCPYWRRSAAQPFSDFGSNLGNDAGMNLVHEFGPGIQQLMKSHAPKFVTKVEEGITHN